MGRQTNLKAEYKAGNTAGTSINIRIDPYALPQSFRYNTGLSGEAAEASVVLDRGLATICRRLPSGIPMAIRMPMDIFEGVAVRMLAAHDNTDDGAVTIVIELLHRDPALSLPLLVTTSMDDIVADWRAWGKILCLPLLTVESDGSYKPVEERLGCVSVKPVQPRRRRTVLSKRRPRFLARRRAGDLKREIVVEPLREITSWE